MFTAKVLVFPGATEIGLEINRALRDCKGIEICGAGSGDSHHGPFAYNNWQQLSSVHESGWLEELNSVVSRCNVDYIFPAHDDVLLALAEKSERLKAHLVTSPLSTCRVARFKSLTYSTLSATVRTPRVFKPETVDSFPVFVKPDRGQGAFDARIVQNGNDLNQHLSSRDYPCVICEYLPGPEYTVDCFSDREKGLLFTGPRKRVRTRNGIAMNSVTVADSDFRFHEFAKKICSILPFHGAWFFQVKESREGELVLLEVAPRIAGCMALNRVRGVNFALLSLYESARLHVDIRPMPGEFEVDRALINRYCHDINFSTVYIDLDDTIVLRDRINVRVIAFLFQCVNEGRRLILLTRHKGCVDTFLRRFRIESLFDSVVHLSSDDRKSDFVSDPNAIFIDDSFTERQEVQSKAGIPAFDCDAIELLINDRV